MEQPGSVKNPINYISINNAKTYIDKTDTIFVEEEKPNFKPIQEGCFQIGMGFGDNFSPPQIFGCGGKINIKKKYGDDFATTCAFYIDYRNINSCNVFNYNIEQFYKCMKKFSNYIENEEKKFKNIIFNIDFFNYLSLEDNRICQQEIKKFAENHNTVRIYNVLPKQQQQYIS